MNRENRSVPANLLTKSRRLRRIVVLLGVVLGLAVVLAPEARAAQPCCEITAIDTRTGVVAAKEVRTGKTFQFKVTNASLLKTLKVGQKVWANFGTHQVSVDGASPCCEIVNLLSPSTTVDRVQGKLFGGSPCCDISAIRVPTGIATAFDPGNGRTFEFKVTDARILKGLRVGQKVWADFGTRKVSVDGGVPCCEIVSVAPAKGAAPPVAAIQGAPSPGTGREMESPASAAKSGNQKPKGTVASTSGTTPTASEGDTAMAIRGKPAPPAQQERGRMGVLSPASENEDGQPDPAPRLPAASRLNLAAANPGSRVVALKDLPQAQQMLGAIAQAIAGKEINVALLGGHKYMVNDCLGIKASAGEFTLRFSKPTVGFEGLAFKEEVSIDRIALNALKVRMRPSTNPAHLCHFSKAFAIGGSASNVRVELRIGGPTFDPSQCRLASLGGIDVRWHIGGLNLKPLQNNLDEVAKEMLQDALNAASPEMVSGTAGVIEASLNASCQTKVALYRRYMDLLGAEVGLYHLPETYVNQLKEHYPKVDLRIVRFGYSGRQEPGNATTDCHTIYFGSTGMVKRLKDGALLSDPDALFWLYHELRHTEQCNELGGRDPYAERWFRDLDISALTTNLNSAHYYRVLHDRMPMEKDADARGHAVYGKVPTLVSP